jgi:hypothetical protein
MVLVAVSFLSLLVIYDARYHYNQLKRSVKGELIFLEKVFKKIILFKNATIEEKMLIAKNVCLLHDVHAASKYWLYQIWRL